MTTDRLMLDRFIPYRLSVTSNVVSDVIASAYRSLFGLSIPEWRIVAVVAEHEGVTQQEIGAVTRMDKVTVSRAAIALGERGLLARVPNPADGRSRLLALSEAGERLYAEVVPKALELEKRILDAFEDEELARFDMMLRRIEAAALGAAGRKEAGS